MHIMLSSIDDQAFIINQRVNTNEITIESLLLEQEKIAMGGQL